jgi:hypothetical protein
MKDDYPSMDARHDAPQSRPSMRQEPGRRWRQTPGCTSTTGTREPSTEDLARIPFTLEVLSRPLKCQDWPKMC